VILLVVSSSLCLFDITSTVVDILQWIINTLIIVLYCFSSVS